MATPEHLRSRMVDALCSAGRVRSAPVEEALRAVPRHLFLPGVALADAYADEAVAVQRVGGVTTSSASQPSMMAIMLEQLDLRPGHRVLEIGAGTGYNAALMARIVGPSGRVHAVDIDAELVDRAAAHLAAAGVADVALCCGDGATGLPAAAPYDRIVLTVGSADVRQEWVAQLAAGGRLLLPLAVRGSQLSVAFDLGPDGVLRSASVRGCAFIRLRGVAADPDGAMRLPGGLALQVFESGHEGAGPDPRVLAVALAEPGDLVPVPVALTASDVWDGFGLWLALTEPGAGRLLAVDTEAEFPDQLLARGPGSATVTLAAAPPGGPAGIAALVRSPHGGDRAGRGPVAVRPFGPTGQVLAARLLAAVDAWTAAGSPGAPDWRITAVPAGGPAGQPEPSRAVVGDPGPLAGPFVIRTGHCWLLVDLPAAPGRATAHPAAH